VEVPEEQPQTAKAKCDSVFIRRLNYECKELNIFSLNNKITNKKKFWEELIAYFPLMQHGLRGK
jgi:hypothetical protein